VELMTNVQIRERRMELKMTQRRLAQLLHVHPNNLCRFELGKAQSLRIQMDATRILSAAGNPGATIPQSIRGLS